MKNIPTIAAIIKYIMDSSKVVLILTPVGIACQCDMNEIEYI